MGLYRFLHRGAVAGVTAAALGAVAQSGVTVNVGGSLLPANFGEWKTAASAGDAPAFSLANAKKAALEECGPQRSAVADYERGGKHIHVEAIQFNDRTGAYSAFTTVVKPGMKPGKDIGSAEAVGDGLVLFQQSSSLVLVNGTTEAASLKPLAD